MELQLFPVAQPIQETVNKSKDIVISNPQVNLPHPQTSLENAFKAIFPQNSEQENNIVRTRRILGETAKTLTDPQIETIVTEFQFLLNTWLDEFEKEIFSGFTLKEVINQT